MHPLTPTSSLIASALALLGRNLLRNLSAGARLVFFRPIGVADFRISPADFAVLFTLNVLVWIAAAAIRIGADGDLNRLHVHVKYNF